MGKEFGPEDEITREDLDLIGSDGDKEGSGEMDQTRDPGPDDGDELG